MLSNIRQIILHRHTFFKTGIHYLAIAIRNITCFKMFADDKRGTKLRDKKGSPILRSFQALIIHNINPAPKSGEGGAQGRHRARDVEGWKETWKDGKRDETHGLSGSVSIIIDIKGGTEFDAPSPISLSRNRHAKALSRFHHRPRNCEQTD